MNEAEARDWIADRFGAHAVDRIAAILDRVAAENLNQNLIAPSTVAAIWCRHAVDSAQLAPLGPAHGLWVDVGTGGGFPGLIIAAVRAEPIVLVEPRRKRAEFLQAVVSSLGLLHARVAAVQVERFTEAAGVISARAVASLEKLLEAAQPCAKTNTRWLLPRGRLDEQELDAVRGRWNGMFHVKQSVTSSSSSIVVAEGVRPR